MMMIEDIEKMFPGATNLIIKHAKDTCVITEMNSHYVVSYDILARNIWVTSMEDELAFLNNEDFPHGRVSYPCELDNVKDAVFKKVIEYAKGSFNLRSVENIYHLMEKGDHDFLRIVVSVIGATSAASISGLIQKKADIIKRNKETPVEND